MLVDRLRPDQLILHGSAARGEMTERSDLDFLSIRAGHPEPSRNPTQHRWYCAETGDVVDVLLVSREQLENNRLAGGTVYAAALTEGRTVFASPGIKPVALHPEAPEAESMAHRKNVRTTLFAPDNATYDLKLAGAFLRSADVAAEEAPEAGCRNLQESAERSLKALVIARGRPVEHTHNLRDLWDRAEAVLGERISAEAGGNLLDLLTLYAGRYSHAPAMHHDPAELYGRARTVVGDLHDYAARRVPPLAAAAEERLVKDPRQATDRLQADDEAAPAAGAQPRGPKSSCGRVGGDS